jgi:hypothetical protein
MKDDVTTAAEAPRDLPPSACSPSRGAYGLRLFNFAQDTEILIDAPAQWTPWQIDHVAEVGTPDEFVTDTRGCLRLAPEGWADIDREARKSTLHLAHRPTLGAIAHPYLASTAITAAHWHGFNSFHAGAFLLDGAAWAVLGARGAGKSTLLATLCLRETPILTDDVLILGGDLMAFAGPRCIDLRREPAEVLDVGEYQGVMGTRERWRLGLDRVEAEVPFAGWICPVWGETGLQIVPPEERVAVLFQNLALRVEQHATSALSRLMDLFALPMLRYSRPRDITSLDGQAEWLISRLRALDDVARG